MERPEIMKHFAYAHLPAHLQAVSMPFCRLAEDMILALPRGGPERTTLLRKLLEAKDCAVRSMNAEQGS